MTVLLTATCLAEAKRVLRAHPDCRVIGGGTVLVPQLDRDGWDGPLLDVTRWPETARLRSWCLGASVTLGAVGRAVGQLPPHLVAAAAQVGSPVVRDAATVGGNCAPEVAGCVYLTLLSMRANADTVTEDGRASRPLLGWSGDSARLPLLTGVSWEPARLTAGGFARSSRHAGGGTPRCAVAVTVFADPPGMRVVIGYAADRPVIVELERMDVPDVLATVLDQVVDLVSVTAVRACLAAALASVVVVP